MHKVAWMLFTVAVLISFVIGRSALSHPARAGVLQQTIYMDPPYDTMEFSPPTLTDQQPALTLAQALSAFEQQAPGFVAPPDSTFQLGRYTAAVGNGDYRFRDVLAWGIRYHECAQLRHAVDSVTSIPCTRWIFIDATTGEMMEAVYQH